MAWIPAKGANQHSGEKHFPFENLAAFLGGEYGVFQFVAGLARLERELLFFGDIDLESGVVRNSDRPKDLRRITSR